MGSPMGRRRNSGYGEGSVLKEHQERSLNGFEHPPPTWCRHHGLGDARRSSEYQRGHNYMDTAALPKGEIRCARDYVGRGRGEASFQMTILFIDVAYALYVHSQDTRFSALAPK